MFSMVLESVPARLAGLITERVSVPTISIGAGPYCDGEVQVIYDILGLYPDFTPRHTRRYAEVGQMIHEAVTTYIAEVRSQTFPTAQQSSSMDAAIVQRLRAN